MLASKKTISFTNLFVLMLFIILTADYSPYYIPYGNVFFPILVFFVLFILNRNLIDFNKTMNVCIYVLVCLFVFCFHFMFSYQAPNIRFIVQLFIVSSFLYLSPSIRLQIYDKFIRILALLLFFAIVEYLFILIGFSFYWGQSIRASNGISFYQALLNLEPCYYSSFFRFQFITEEPGLIGTLCFFIIATLNKEKYKKEFVIFIIAGIISFSLAFYILTILWGISKLKISNLKYFLLPLVLYIVFYDAINEKIVDRVIIQSEAGSLDNRNTKEINTLFDDMRNNGKIIIGVGYKEFYTLKKQLGYSTGVKSFIMQYGIMGFMLVFIAYSYTFFQYNKINYSNAVVLTLFWLSFYQRCDLNFEPNLVILYSYSLNELPKTLISKTQNLSICHF